jgi:flagellar assembly factor FliW
LVGFPDARHFSLGMLGDLDRPFMLLRSADRFALSFVVLPLASGGSAGSPPLRTSDACERLGINADDLAVLLIVTLRPGSIGTAATVNLRAPLLIDTRRQLGWQIVQENPALPVRLPLQPGA